MLNATAMNRSGHGSQVKIPVTGTEIKTRGSRFYFIATFADMRIASQNSYDTEAEAATALRQAAERWSLPDDTED